MRFYFSKHALGYAIPLIDVIDKLGSILRTRFVDDQ